MGRGRKRFEERTPRLRPLRKEFSHDTLMPFRVIACKLGVSARTVDYDYRRAVEKLKRIPGAFDFILGALRHEEPDQRSLIGCLSVECRTEFINLYGEAVE